MRRRRFLGAAGAALGAGVAGCTDALTPAEGGQTSLSTLEAEGGISVAAYRWGIEQGVWADRGIDLSFETAAFGRYNRQVVGGDARIGAPSTVAQIKFVEKGEPLTFVGQQLNMFNRMFVRSGDESIEDPSDLGDKVLGLPAALSSTTATVHRALIADEYGFDIVEDTRETRAADPPVLWELLQQGELDAISEFSGFTIKGIASDSVRTIFDPYALWTDRTGVGIPTTTFTARPAYVAENAGTVEDFLDGWAAAVDSLQANAADALDEFGAAAGITEEAEARVVRDLMAEGVVFGPAYYDEELADAHWQFFELLADAGVFALGDRDAIFTTAAELRG